MKLLITGATGLIGSAITARSLQRNDTVHYLTTSRGKIKTTEHSRGFYWNPDTGEIDMECFEGVDAIINLAGASVAKRWTTARKQQILNSRIASLKLLDVSIAKLKHHHITSIVTASGIGVYPNSPVTHYEEDEANVDPTFLGHVVVQWEKAADQLKKHGIPLAKIRTGLVLSAAGGALPPMKRSVKYGVGAPFGDGSQWQSWIHIDDIARLFLFAADHGLEGAYNGVAPNPVIQKKLLKEVALQLKSPLFLPGIPKFVIKAILGEMAYILYSSQRACSKKIREEGFNFNFKTIHTALGDLL